jgi:hypothetical protein
MMPASSSVPAAPILTGRTSPSSQESLKQAIVHQSPLPELAGRFSRSDCPWRLHLGMIDEPNVIGSSRPQKGGVTLTVNVVLLHRLRCVRQEAPAAELRDHRDWGGLGAVRKALRNGE